MEFTTVEQGTASQFREVINDNFSLVSSQFASVDESFADIESDTETLSGDTSPTTSTVGIVGQEYIDTTTGYKYYCKSISGSTYTWERVMNSNSIILSSTEPTIQEAGDLWFEVV